jgi:hypothetical protein
VYKEAMGSFDGYDTGEKECYNDFDEQQEEVFFRLF